MTLVARVTFLVLVGASFSAFFVAQRLKSTPPVIEVAQDHALLLAQRRREARHERHLDPAAGGRRRDGRRRQPRRRPRQAAGRERAGCSRTARCGWCGTAAPTAARARRTGNTGCASRCATRGARRRSRRRCTVDTKAAALGGLHRLQVHRHQADGQRDLPGRSRAPVLHPRCLALPDASRCSTAPTRASRARSSDLSLPGQAQPRRAGTGSWTASRCRSGHLHRPGAGARHGRQRRRHAGRVRASARSPAGPGLTVRGLAAQPPVRPVTAGQRVEFGVDARGAEYRWRVRRVGDSAVRKRGSETGPVLAVPRARPARRASTCSSCAPAAGTRRCRSSCRPRSARASSWSCRRSPGWARTRSTTGRSTACRTRSRTAARCAGRARFVGTDGLPAGFAEQIAPLLVFLDRRRIRYDLTSDLDLDLTRNPRATRPRGRAVRRLGALDHPHAGPAPAPLRARRRPRRHVRRRLDAPRRAAARVRRRGLRDAVAGRRSRRRPIRSARGSASSATPVGARHAVAVRGRRRSTG